MIERKWVEIAERQLFRQAVAASGTIILGTAAVVTLLFTLILALFFHVTPRVQP